MLRAAPQHHQVVHVAVPKTFTERLLQVPVERCSGVDVGEDLRRQAADRQTGAGARHHRFDQPQRGAATDLGFDQAPEDVALDRGEIAREIGLEEEHRARSPQPSQVALQLDHAGVGALARATGERARQQRAVENRRDHQAQRLLRDAVAERQRRDQPQLRIENMELMWCARLIGTGRHIPRQVREIERAEFLEVQITGGQPLAGGGQAIGRFHGGQCRDPSDQIAITLGHAEPAERNRPRVSTGKPATPRSAGP